MYKLDPSGHETVLHYFTNGADGGAPIAGVILDSAGNLYGTTYGGGQGGASGQGVVYKLDPSGKQTVLYSFTIGAGGARPQAGVTRDSAGNLYGTTLGGGIAGLGVVYKLDPSGQETVLCDFPGTDGYSPNAGLIRDSAGNLYGTTPNGGPANAGTVFSVDPTGKERVLYSFTNGSDGAYPNSGVIRDSAGNLYGTTSDGGSSNFGVVFKLDTAGHESVLYSFTGGTDGKYPYAGLIRDMSGNFYGTTNVGGSFGAGVVYKLDATGHETVLYAFTGGADGGYPQGIVRDSAGNLYGSIASGGAGGAGLIYKVDTTGHETVLWNFSNQAGGTYPNNVIRDAAGNLYGTTMEGGTGSDGVVFKIDTAGQETVLYNFTGGADGDLPFAGLAPDSAGNVYGTTFYGGVANKGVVYKLDPSGHETVLYSFTGGTDGGLPLAGVVLDSVGNVYGTTSTGGKKSGGVVFKLKNGVQ